jgi:hypothetical protein
LANTYGKPNFAPALFLAGALITQTRSVPPSYAQVSVRLPGAVLQAAVTHSRQVGEPGKEKRGFLQLDPGVVVPGQYDWMHGNKNTHTHTQRKREMSFGFHKRRDLPRSVLWLFLSLHVKDGGVLFHVCIYFSLIFFI